MDSCPFQRGTEGDTERFYSLTKEQGQDSQGDNLAVESWSSQLFSSLLTHSHFQTLHCFFMHRISNWTRSPVNQSSWIQLRDLALQTIDCSKDLIKESVQDSVSKERNATANTDVPKLRAITPKKAITHEKHHADKTQSILVRHGGTLQGICFPLGPCGLQSLAHHHSAWHHWNCLQPCLSVYPKCTNTYLQISLLLHYFHVICHMCRIRG